VDVRPCLGLLQPGLYFQKHFRVQALPGSPLQRTGSHASSKAWIVPNDRSTSTGELVALFFATAGKPMKLFRLSDAIVSTIGIFDPLVREFREMLN